MAPLPWTTHAQLLFLTARTFAFSEHSRAKSLPTFFDVTFDEFLAQWPSQVAEASCRTRNPPKFKTADHPVYATTAEWWADRQKKIRNWFGNHPHKGERVRTPAPAPQQQSQVPLTMSSSTPNTRAKSELHMYSKRFYETRVKPKVEQAIKEKGVSSRRQLGLIRSKTAECYNAEDEETKEIVRRDVAEMKERLRKLQLEPGQPTPADYQAAIDALPQTLAGLLSQLAQKTGWAFTVLAGGPSPKDHGAIVSRSYHSTQNFEGKTFGQAHPAFLEMYLHPFTFFLHQSFSPELAHSRSLTRGDGDDEDMKFEVWEPSSLKIPIGRAPKSKAKNTGSGNNSNTIFASDNALSEMCDEDFFNGYSYTHEDLQADLKYFNDHPDLFPPLGPSVVPHDPTLLSNLDVSPLLPPAPGGLHPVQLRAPVYQQATQFAPEPAIQQPFTTTPSAPVSQQPAQPASTSASTTPSSTSAPVPQQPAQPASTSALAAPTPTPTTPSTSAPTADVTTSTVATIPAPTSTRTPLQDADPQSADKPMHILPEERPPALVQVHPVEPPPAAPIQSANTPSPKEQAPLLSSSSLGQGHPASPPSPALRSASSPSVSSDANDRPIELPTPEEEASEPWVEEMKMYLAQDLDHHVGWRECLEAWVLFERRGSEGGFSSSSRLPGGKYRPKELSVWVDAGVVSVASMSPPTDLATFGQQWKTWWNGMQPAWRRSDSDRSLPSPVTSQQRGQSLSTIKRCGPTGLFTALVGLKWWARPQEDQSDWTLWVGDLTACFNMLSGESDGKRKGEGDVVVPPKRRKRI